MVLNPTKQRVPKYRFHHVEIAKNILTPSTNLRFLPYTRDVVDMAEEGRYYKWIESLKSMDQTDGMDTLALENSHLKNNEKAKFMARKEFAATLHPYLERWIERLGLEHCDRSALIHYMASETADDDSAITPQQKSTLLESGLGRSNSPHSHAAAKAFTEAFDRVFGRRATLREVLMLDEEVEDLLQSSKKTKEPTSSQNLRDEEFLRELEDLVATYNLFSCLICYGHSCDHGSINTDENTQSRFGITNILGRMAPMVRKRWSEQTKKNPQPSPASAAVTVCKNQCFQGSHPTAPAPPEWSAKEIQCLKTIFAAQAKSSVRPECTVATILSRKCWDVRGKLVGLNLSLPYSPPSPEQPWARNVGWYDRSKKILMADWQEQTSTYEFQTRELTEPCHHEGACTAANGCPCVYGKILCDRFCQCSADSCPYKFTGCSCHSTGKTCVERVKGGEKSCVCIMLNRECDPVLCRGCGAADRANPVNAHDDALHATGCQNVPLQRGLSKAVLMGASQLEGCGYGLFTAEEIAQDEFVIEYTGELIKADEGVRREARRGNVFDESKNTSYLFTLLETEGVWVDAAVYGNLSRYINHAGDGDKKGANLTPKIVYVLGEYRIRFNATRDIRTGEELFFNYGDNFPNLTKKLLEDKDAAAGGRRKPGPKRKPGRPPSKMVKNKQKDGDFASPSKRGRPRARANATKKAPTSRAVPDPDEMDWEAHSAIEEEEDEGEEEGAPSAYFSPSGRGSGAGGRGHRGSHRIPPPPEDEDDYDEYRPEGQTDSQEDMEAYTLARDRRRRRIKSTQNLQRFLSGDHASELRTAGVLSSDPAKTAAEKTTTAQAAAPNKDNKGKPVSRRGGARPGAGRKPKNPKPATAASVPAESEEGEGEEEEEEDEEEEIGDSYAAAEGDSDSDDVPLVETGRGYSLRNRKRKSAERDEEESGFGEDRGDFSELCANGGEEEEEDEDEDDVIDRSRRKRQKPARYRADE
jgi:hypothetical protein